MKKHYEPEGTANFARELLIGLGETSVRKNYYPELQQRMAELERFRLLLDQAQDAIFLVDISTLNIVDMNTAARSYTGISSTLPNLIDIGKVLSFDFKSIAADLSHHLVAECTLSGRDGSIPVEVTISRAVLQDIDYAVIVARNVSDRKIAEDRLQATYEELHASYEELESLYGHLSTAEEALRQKVNELQKSEARYRLAMEGANDAIWDWDLINDSLTISSQWYEALGITSETENNHNAFWRAHIHPEDLPIREQALANHLAGRSPYYEVEYRFTPTPGQWLWILAKGKALFDSKGIPTRISGSLTDITERKKYEQQIYYLAYHDTLTGLPNRVSLLEQIDRFLAVAAANKRFGALFMLDIDNFKLVNDSLGHTAGDELLAQVGNRLKAFYPDKTFAARLGGDEFVIFIRETALEELELWAKKILKMFDQPISISGTNLALSCSVGVAAVCADTLVTTDLLRNADTALNQAKAKGKKSFCLYKSGMQEAVIERIQIETELRHALEANELIMYYQPQIDIASKQIIAFEALLRWKHPQKGLIPPLSFIPLAEETGLIIPIGELVIRSACRFGREINKLQSRPVRISVNISARQLMQDNFAATITRIIAEENFPPELIELEITESILMKSFSTNVQIIKMLQAKGITIALDDFGSGYSSLTYLRKLPINVLKIDKEFVQNLVYDNVTYSIVRTIIALANTLHLSVIAEGVETIEQLNALSLLNCPNIQGYLISKPLPAEEALSFEVHL